VESYSKNKFEKCVLLIGFIIRIYRDARSSGCQNSNKPSRWMTLGERLRILHHTVSYNRKQFGMNLIPLLVQPSSDELWIRCNFHEAGEGKRQILQDPFHVCRRLVAEVVQPLMIPWCGIWACSFGLGFTHIPAYWSRTKAGGPERTFLFCCHFRKRSYYETGIT